MPHVLGVSWVMLGLEMILVQLIMAMLVQLVMLLQMLLELVLLVLMLLLQSVGELSVVLNGSVY